jgi:hypothetical protein
MHKVMIDDRQMKKVKLLKWFLFSRQSKRFSVLWNAYLPLRYSTVRDAYESRLRYLSSLIMYFINISHKVCRDTISIREVPLERKVK